MGGCVQTGGTGKYALFSLVCGNLMVGLRGLGVPALFVGSGRGSWVSERSAVVAVWSF